MPNFNIKSIEDLLDTFDRLFQEPTAYWNAVYQERPDYMSFLTKYPDENLVSYFQGEAIKPEKVLELGCGEGRNATYMALQGCKVDAVDFSIEAINKAIEQADRAQIHVNFFCQNVFELGQSNQIYDFVYDSGLMHHLPPHRRFQYIEMVSKLLASGGYWGLICFAPGFTEIGGPDESSDYEVYKTGNMVGGMAYSKHKLLEIFSEHFDLIEIRYMKETDDKNALFGKPFLWASLWRKKNRSET